MVIGRGTGTGLSGRVPLVVTALAAAAALAVTGPAAGRAAVQAGAGRAVRAQLAGPAAGTITTVTGGVGGPGPAVRFALDPCSVTFADGHLYIGDDLFAREMSPGSDRLTTLAGSGLSGSIGNRGPAAGAAFRTCGAAADGAGDLAITDYQDNLVRVVAAGTGTLFGQAMLAGHIYTLAGDRQKGFSGDGGPGTSAEIYDPQGVAFDAAGNVLFADAVNGRIRVVAAHTGIFYGQAMTIGDIYTVAGGGGSDPGDGGPATAAALNVPQGVSVDGAGNLLISDSDSGRVQVVAGRTGTFYGQAMTIGDIYTVAGGGTSDPGDGGPAISADISPQSVVTDAAGNLVICDLGNERVRVVAVRTGTFYGQAMTAGDIYTIAGTGTLGLSGDGGPATSAELSFPSGAAVDSAGNVVIADGSSVVRVVAATTGTFYGRPMTAGDIYTVGGHRLGGVPVHGMPALHVQVDPRAVAVDGAGNLLIADTNDNEIDVQAASTGTFYGQPMTTGRVYTVAGTGAFGRSGLGGPAVRARLGGPDGVTVDGAGNLVFADLAANRVQVVAERTGTFYGQAMTAGDIYTVAGTGRPGCCADGGPAVDALLFEPEKVSVDAAGNLLIADSGNNRVRVVAASTGMFYGQAMTAGDIYTIAGGGSSSGNGGGLATHASLAVPIGVRVDPNGNVLIADTAHNRIRVVPVTTGTFYGQAMTALHIYTIAGTGKQGFSGDRGPAVAAQLSGPWDMLVDGAGNVVIADSGNNRARVVAEHTGTFYGVPMTAGNVYTIAGTGTLGFSGDGGPATQAELTGASGLAVDGTGDLLIADDMRIRLVTG